MTEHDQPSAVTKVARDLRALPDRFWSKVNKSETCWLWTACLSSEGYGVYGRGAKLAHRLTYADAHGPIPVGLMVDHKCRVRACCNPSHLQLVTNQLNQQNRSGPPSNNTSGVRGVHWAPDHKKWRASVRHNGRRHYAGYFDSIHDAEAAVVALRNLLHTNNLMDREIA